MDISYTKANPNDAALLVDLYNKSFYNDYIRHGSCPGYGRSIDRMKQSVAAYPKTIISSNGIPVGVISAQDDGDGSINLGCLCIIPIYQNQGIGTKALQNLYDTYPEYQNINLVTPADKLQNIHFYTKKNGFSITGTAYDGDIKLVKLRRTKDSIKYKSLSQMSLEELWQLFPIKLERPQSCWKQWYEDEKKIIEKNIPCFLINKVYHIGSTAIDGIWAKPTVDILLEVKENVQISCVEHYLFDCGYILMSDETTRKSYNKGYTPTGFAERVFHLHLRNKDDIDEVYFRNYMLKHPEDAKKYEKLKIDLWSEYVHHRDNYTDAKTEFVKSYTLEAKRHFKMQQHSN